MALALGRDGAIPIMSQSRSNFRVGPVSLPYTSVHFGVGTLWTPTSRSSGGMSRASSPVIGLKNIMRELGLEREDRTHVRGEDIAGMWRAGERSRERLARYALDDVRDVDRLSA